MVYCVAYGCKNSSASGKSFFLFPYKEKEPARWRQWVRMVNRKNWTPSPHEKLCQDHFERSCFVSDPTVLDSVGFKLVNGTFTSCLTLWSLLPFTFWEQIWHF
ncbi:THAP domain-containing protein 2-like isoform X1 [Tachypleus tridentatus]|uniref:THAP domain-containing protein 2-like isoform X1 n=1 Tax=Tachypleus tridentatus TaxID=6853 RepID=UPI003FD15CFE